MNTEEFDYVLKNQLLAIETVLGVKAGEYATDDRLHNFKVAAELEKTSPQAALAGMMAKHTVSIYDMCRSDKRFDLTQWNEKITDHLNYLILLKAIVVEQSMDQENQLPLTSEN